MSKRLRRTPPAGKMLRTPVSTKVKLVVTRPPPNRPGASNILNPATLVAMSRRHAIEALSGGRISCADAFSPESHWSPQNKPAPALQTTKAS